MANRARTAVKAQRGFTIVEILIVLAIGGLIIFITFLAVPALERGNRNGERKQSVATLLGEISNYQLTHTGESPPTCAPSITPTCTSNSEFADGTNEGYYVFTTSAAVVMCHGSLNGSGVLAYPIVNSICSQPNGSNQLPPASSYETLTFYNYARCLSGSGGIATTQGADGRSVVALYALENGNDADVTPLCQQLGE